MKKLQLKKKLHCLKRLTVQQKGLLASIFLSSISSLVYADINNGVRIAHPPYHIKPNTSLLTPSGLSPAQITQAYGFSSIAHQGEGQVIAIIDAYDSPNAEADLAVFNTTFGLPDCTTANGCFQKIYASGSQPPVDLGWGVEMALDVQWAHAVAPKAKILLVEAADATFASLLKAVEVAVQNGAIAVSMSWGAGEFSGENQFDSIFNAPGVTYFASSGDSGSGVMYPAASPNVVAVGGTTLSIDASGNYAGETAWGGSGGGISGMEAEPPQQASFPIPNNPNKGRGVPDVAYNADPNSGVSIYDSAEGGWLVVGGTSAGSPQWAGLIAVLQSAATNQVVNINTLLYTTALNYYSATFHDIVSGSNGSCGANCTAQTGYDYVTGLGSPKVPGLINAIAGGQRIPI